MGDNMFLKNFVKMRTAEAKKEVDKKPTNLIDMEELVGPSYLTIIEDKPVKSVVLEYFRKRISELEAED